LLDETLLGRNIAHFEQAKNTPFTTQKLIEYIGEDGCHPNVYTILQGEVNNNIPSFVNLLLQQFKSNTQPILTILFMKWR
jgi:hypothetical protein